jgi:hypothetical protein
MICKCNREVEHPFTVGKSHGRGTWKPWIVKPATDRSRLKLCKPCATLEASARNNRRHAKNAPSILTAAKTIGEFLSRLGRPAPDTAAALASLKADAEYSAVLKVTGHFYDEIVALEVDTVSEGSSADHKVFADVWIKNATRIGNKRPRFRVTLNLAALCYLYENLEYHVDLWIVRGLEGASLVRYAENLKPKLEAWLP